MRGITVSAPGADYKLVENLERPVPGAGQVLIKSLYTGLNPVETLMQSSGLLVTVWPIVLGVDASGTVVEIGGGVTKFKVGDGIFGCTRLGIPGYGTFQEYHLMDEHLAFKRSDNITAEQAATLGVGILTAYLGLVAGLGLTIPSPNDAPKHDEWIIILGGSGSVGQYAVRLANLCGYKVIASSSPSKSSLVTAAGASASFDYRLPLPEQISTVSLITDGKFNKILDASAASADAALAILQKASKVENKKFASVDDWSPMSAHDGSNIDIYRIHLGMLGRFGEGKEEEEINRALFKGIADLERLIGAGSLLPMRSLVVGVGFEAVPAAIQTADSGIHSGKKCVVKLQE